MADETLALVWLGLCWLGYGLLHSGLAATSVRSALGRRWPALGARYRLAFNSIAVITLAPALWLLRGREWTLLWAEPAWLRGLLNGLAILALLGLMRSARHCDMAGFLGLSRRSTVGGLRISPWHRHVRHPCYALALVLLWTRPPDTANLLTAALLSLYLIIGSRLEEHKLLAEFGEAYARYRAAVPGLLPWPGRCLHVEQAAQLEAQAAAHFKESA